MPQPGPVVPVTTQQDQPVMSPRTAGILSALLAAGGPVVILLVKYFHLTPDQANAFVTALLTFVTAATPIAAVIWQWVITKRENRIKAVAAMPEVDKVVLHPVDSTMASMVIDKGLPKIVSPSENRQQSTTRVTP